MIPRLPANEKELLRLIKRGEGLTLEFKRSTGELREGMQTVCAFLNGSGGMVLFGARSDGMPEGQQVSDKTLREIAQAFERFEPPVNIDIRRVKVKDDREVPVLSVDGSIASRPCLFEGRPYERLETATCRMPQEKYEKLLLERVHSRSRWENAPAEEVEPRDLDGDEVFRILDAARSSGRLIGSVGNRVVDMLDRLGVRRNGKILQAAMVLFGRTFLPDYPQCELRMARFRGTDKTEFLDQRQIRGPAFKLLEEAELFCQRHFPLPGKIVSGRMERVDTPLIPPDAMREILVNALIHRDYSIAGGAVSLAIFDNRVEIWSAGTYPAGITPDMLTRDHPSVQRNPIIADVFYRAGLIERWGRGTNRVIEMCRTANVRPPEFQEIGHAAVVTFWVNVAGAVPLPTQVTTQATIQVTTQVERVLVAARRPSSAAALQKAAGLKNRVHFLKTYLEPLFAAGWIERTIPEKPRSPLQRYRIGAAGEQALKKTKEE